jgi:hypothetical protein
LQAASFRATDPATHTNLFHITHLETAVGWKGQLHFATVVSFGKPYSNKCLSAILFFFNIVNKIGLLLSISPGIPSYRSLSGSAAARFRSHSARTAKKLIDAMKCRTGALVSGHSAESGWNQAFFLISATFGSNSDSSTLLPILTIFYQRHLRHQTLDSNCA